MLSMIEQNTCRTNELSVDFARGGKGMASGTALCSLLCLGLALLSEGLHTLLYQSFHSDSGSEV